MILKWESQCWRSLASWCHFVGPKVPLTMSTALNSTQFSSRLIGKLALQEESFHNCSPGPFLGSVVEAANQIWATPDLTNFTNHDLRHSERLIDYFMELEPLYHWSPYERLLFATAALIHDIGMQYNKWGPKADPDFPTEGLDEGELRRRHTELGFSLVSRQLNHGKVDLRFPPRFAQYTHGNNNALHRSACIGFSHSGRKGEELLRIMIEDRPTWGADDKLEGGKYRPRLLAGIFGIIDELDGSYQRIDQPDRLMTLEIGDTSKSHWLACLFVRGCRPEIKDRSVEINVAWQIPEGASDSQIKDVKGLLQQVRLSKMRIEINKAKEFL